LAFGSLHSGLIPLHAEEAVNLVLNVGNFGNRTCKTTRIPLMGAVNWNPNYYIELIQKYKISSATAKYLSHSYGSKAPAIIKIANENNLWKPLAENYPFIEAEVVYCIKYEYATTVVDMLARRVRLSFLNSSAALKAVNRVLEIMKNELHWDEARCIEERQDAERFLSTMHC